MVIIVDCIVVVICSVVNAQVLNLSSACNLHCDIWLCLLFRLDMLNIAILSSLFKSLIGCLLRLLFSVVKSYAAVGHLVRRIVVQVFNLRLAIFSILLINSWLLKLPLPLVLSVIALFKVDAWVPLLISFRHLELFCELSLLLVNQRRSNFSILKAFHEIDLLLLSNPG